MVILLACVTGFILDMIFGDPIWLYHPVRLIGAWISFLETWLLKIAGKSESAQLAAGGVLWILTASVFTLFPFWLLKGAEMLHPMAAFLLESFWCYQLLAARSLSVESKKVYHCLKAKDVEGARKAVSMIVGRDTENLTEEGITKAAVETVAENTSDGVIAPLFYMAIFGIPGGFFYKAVNTMDSMIGYKNKEYLYFGRVAARLDDICNYIPSRLAAIFMVLASALRGFSVKGAWKIWRRDSRKHKSPNSAQTESACAGALQIQLAGDAWYFGELCEKPTIGDAIRPVEKEDIIRANKLMMGTTLVGSIIFLIMRLVVICVIR